MGQSRDRVEVGRETKPHARRTATGARSHRPHAGAPVLLLLHAAGWRLPSVISVNTTPNDNGLSDIAHRLDVAGAGWAYPLPSLSGKGGGGRSQVLTQNFFVFAFTL